MADVAFLADLKYCCSQALPVEVLCDRRFSPGFTGMKKGGVIPLDCSLLELSMDNDSVVAKGVDRISLVTALELSCRVVRVAAD